MWSTLLERELAEIPRDREALIWAIGCVWAVNVERFMCKARPIASVVLLGAGLYVGTHYLLAHLTWYGLPRDHDHWSDQYRRDLLKLGICGALFILIATVTPGPPRRRLFAALTFPFIALAVRAATTFGLGITGPLDFAGTRQGIEMLVWGMLFGGALALLLTLPAVLLYRRRATPIAALALIPAIARTASQPHQSGLGGDVVLVAQVATFMCALILIAVLTRMCRRWLGRVSHEGDGA